MQKEQCEIKIDLFLPLKPQVPDKNKIVKPVTQEESFTYFVFNEIGKSVYSKIKGVHFLCKAIQNSRIRHITFEFTETPSIEVDIEHRKIYLPPYIFKHFETMFKKQQHLEHEHTIHTDLNNTLDKLLFLITKL